MQRIYLVMAAILVSLFAYGCGGGSTTTADPNSPAGDNGNSETVLEMAPFTVHGEREVREVDGKLTVRSAVSDAELEAVLGKYNCTLDSRSGTLSTVSVPNGTDLGLLADKLEKEYAISTAGPMHVMYLPAVSETFAQGKAANWVPTDPFYSTEFVGMGDNGTNLIAALFPGQGAVSEVLGLGSAWDVTFAPGAVNDAPVNIAIIDAGHFNYAVEVRPDLDMQAGFEQIDLVNSGFVADDGTFTPGLAAIEWDIFDDGDVNTTNRPFRQTGENMFGMLASLHNNTFSTVTGDTSVGGNPPDGIVDSNEIFNEGIAGLVPSANFILIKTGEASGDAWTFSDAHIAESIDHAVSAGANIILLGMFAQGPVGGNISTALQNAADNDVLCIAPAGDVILSYNGTGYDETPVDLSGTDVTPASDPNCVSVGSTGFKRVDYAGLAPFDPGTGEIPNNGRAWRPFRINGLDEPYFAIQAASNTGADIYAPGFGIGWAMHPYSPEPGFPGHNHNLAFSAFGTVPAATYVAGAAAMVFKALTAANGSAPSDEEVMQAINDNLNQFVDFSPENGLLNISSAVNAIAGGGVSGPSMGLSIPAGQLVPATLLTTFQLAPTVTGGTGPFDLSIDWGDGNAPVVVNNWANQDPVALDGGWDTLGKKTILVTVTETGGDMRSANRTVEIPVYNAITTNLTVMGPIDPEDPGLGEQLFAPGAAIQDAVTYTFSANVANVFNGSVDGMPNNPQFGWDFDGDDVIDKPGTTVEHAFISTGNFNVKFIVTQDVFPDFEVTRGVLVN